MLPPINVKRLPETSHEDIVRGVIACIRDVVGNETSVALHEPNLGELEQRYVLDCVASGWVSSVGSYVDRFENQLAEYTGASHVIATVNGTSALHVCLLLAGVACDDEVICPALSFVATANAITYCRAVPHFVDVEFKTLGLDAAKLRDYLAEIAVFDGGTLRNRQTGRRIAAIVPMHTLGHSVDVDSLQEVANSFGIPIVEDAAESLGTFYGGRHTGTFGLLGAISFNGNKIATTGGGGAILTNDADLAIRAKHLTTTAKRPHRWRYEHDESGFNYRMPNLNAAMGCAQLERFSDFRNRKQILANRYKARFADFSEAEFVDQWDRESCNYWLNAIYLQPTVGSMGSSSLRDQVLELTNDSGLMTRPMWELLSGLPMYINSPQMDLSVSEELVRRIVCLPSSVCLG